MVRILPTTTALFISLALATECSADFLVGRIVTTQGAPVFGANLDVFLASNGTELTLTNDGTQADGTFAVQVPAGTYDVVFNAPPPPATRLVGTQINGLFVSGTTNIGDVVLIDGQILSGSFTLPSGQPAVDHKLEMVDEVTGQELVMTSNRTDATGNFLTTAPAGWVSLRIQPDRIPPISAPREITTFLGSDTNLGNLALAVGHLVTATITNAGGLPVLGVDLDAKNVATGIKAYTPDDNSNSAGQVEVVLPTGVFDIDFCVDSSQFLAPLLLQNNSIGGTTNLGTQVMQTGYILTGLVTLGGQPTEGIDLDLFATGSGTPVHTCMDNTDATGWYATVVPAGQYDILFSDAANSCGSSTLVQKVTVQGSTVQHASLDASVIGCRFCWDAVANSAGCSGHAYATGSLNVAANQVQLKANGIPPNQFGIFLVSRLPGFVANPGASQGNLCLGGFIGRYNKLTEIVSSGASGQFSLPINLNTIPTPASGPVMALPGETWYFQAWYRDQNPSNTSNFSDVVALPFQ